MSRYNGNNGGSNGSNDDNNYDDSISLNIKPYSTLRFAPTSANGNKHDQYGASFITNYDDAEILDGVVLQRDDDPSKWSIYSADQWFNLNPEDGLVYEHYSDDDGYTNQMSAQDILEHPRVVGHSTSGGGNSYYFTPVGAVIEEAGDIAMNPDIDAEATDEPAIVVGDASTLLGNNSWVRTFAKKMSTEGDSIVNDNGKKPTGRDEDDVNPKYNDFEWMTTHDPDLRSDLKGRSLELWVTREEADWGDDSSQTYLTPNLMDVKTGEFVTIDNGVESDDDTGTEQAKAADGGTTTESGNQSSTSTAEPESSTEPDGDSNSGGLPENVPDKLDDLIGYMARNGETTPDEIRDFAEDEVDNPDDIDWEAAANEANQRAE